MAKLGISTGIVPDDGTGDSLLDGAVKINSNFDDIYTYFGDGTNLTFTGGGVSSQWVTTGVGIHTLSNVGIGTTNPRFALEVGAVGASGTTLYVNGDARVTGILTVGSASITLNGSTNIINVGTGITINGSTGIISATSIVLGGTTLTGSAVTSITAGSGISVDQSTGNVTISATGGGGGESYWVETSAGIHTLSNVGIGTTNPTSTLTVSGALTVTGVATINGINISAGNNDSNTGVGKESLLSVSGQENTAFGRSALFSTLGGQGNTGIGYQALYTSSGTTPNSSYNTALGWKAMRLNTTGSQNVAVGGQALESNLSGSGNVALGQAANNANTTANYNTSVGWGVLAINTTGTKNVAIGAFAGQGGPTSGSYNVLIGPGEQSYSSPTYAPPIIDGSNQLVIGAGNTAWIYGNSSYNVGIGTTNPTSALTVKGNTSLETLNVSGVSTFNGNSKFGDNNKILLGNDGDFEIYFNSSNTILQNSNTNSGGDLYVRSDEILIENFTGTEKLAQFTSNGAVSLYYDNSNKFETTSAGVTITGTTFTNQLSVSGISTLGTVQISSGIVTATSGIVTYYGDTSNATDGRWTLGASGTSDYTFTGIGFTQTTNDPVLYLARGRVYEFVNNSGGSHPFEIRVSNGGAAYSDGVTNNAAATGVIRFEIPFNAPNTLYYQCTVHSGMGNTISVYPSTI